MTARAIRAATATAATLIAAWYWATAHTHQPANNRRNWWQRTPR